MENLFGLSMDRLMVAMLAVFLVIMAVVVFMALRSRVMLRLGLRNIPRRRSQTVLIIIGSMLSAVLIASAFTIGDTISFSIREDSLEGLGAIDEVLTSTGDSDSFGVGTPAYIPRQRFDQLKLDLEGFDAIDGLVPYVGETVASFNPRTSLTEGNTRITGIDADLLQGFHDFVSVDGATVTIGQLDDGAVFINDEAADELDARAGDTVRVFIQGREVDYRVEAVIARGGMAGFDATVIMPLARIQQLLDRPGQINFVAVSNRGDSRAGVELSDEVTRRLRVLLADPEVAEALRILLSQENIPDLLRERASELSGAMATDLNTLAGELQRTAASDELIALLADEDVADQVVDTLGRAGLSDAESRADNLLFNELAQVRVFEFKKFFLDIADDVASGATTFFITIGLFSVMVGILLIFLIFVMLAAARRTEMGMARAIGAKRSHLVQMFVFEGTAYDLAASAVGTAVGLLVSLGIVAIFNHILSRVETDFSFTYHVEVRSAVVAFCAGMIIVFATASVSAYRVSRMNIAEAVRGLPEILVLRSEEPLRRRILYIPTALVQPVILLVRAVGHLSHRNFSRFWLSLGGMLLWFPILPVWWVGIAASLVRFAWPYFRRGWLTFLLGLLLLYVGIGPTNQTAPYMIGASLMIIGVGLMVRLVVLRWPSLAELFGVLTLASGAVLLVHGAARPNLIPILAGVAVAVIGVAMALPLRSSRVQRRPDLIGRLTFTFIGVIMLAFWVLPFDTTDPVTGNLEDDAEMFFVSGIAMVAAAVWTVMYNADLLLKALVVLTSGVGKLRPVLVIAVAYPMSAKFRTGLTLAMFSLVIFTLIVISLVNNAFKNVFSDTDRVTGQWDIRATVAPNSLIEDIRAAIEASPDLSIDDFDAIGGYVEGPVQVRQIGASNKIWESYSLLASDSEYLAAALYDFKILGEGYASKEEVWQALRNDPTLAVIDAAAISSGGGFNDESGSLRIEGVTVDDETMSPFQVEVMEPRTGQQFQYTVIAVLDSAVDLTGIVTSKESVDRAFPFPIPLTTYRFRTAESVDVKQTARNLEAAFVENGMEPTVLEEELADIVSFITSFYNLITGYMGLGLVVGIAALGVVSMRAVVERRQQIGVLRAIGYRRSMVQLSFLLESSFVALLGVAIGVVLGAIISYNLVSQFETELEGIKFTVPWTQIIIIVGLAYVFSLLTTILPARQAASTLPAEALRYE